jgi:hypothetical protein
MSAVTFDTLKFAEDLKKAGFTDEQAGALVKAQRDSLAEALDTTLATKMDIIELKHEIHSIKLDVVRWVVGTGVALLMAMFVMLRFFM